MSRITTDYFSSVSPTTCILTTVGGTRFRINPGDFQRILFWHPSELLDIEADDNSKTVIIRRKQVDPPEEITASLA